MPERFFVLPAPFLFFHLSLAFSPFFSHFWRPFLLFYTFAWCFRGVSMNSCTATHYVCFCFFLSFLGVFTSLCLSLMISMCQREAMFKNLGSAFSFWILISPAICLLGHVLLLFILFHILHLLRLRCSYSTSEIEIIYLWGFFFFFFLFKYGVLSTRIVGPRWY